MALTAVLATLAEELARLPFGRPSPVSAMSTCPALRHKRTEHQGFAQVLLLPDMLSLTGSARSLIQNRA